MTNAFESAEDRWGVLVTARLKSTRLHRKVLRKLNGQPMIWHVLSRMADVNGADNVIVITSSLPTDDDLVDYSQELGFSVFRGHPIDVMTRMLDAASRYKFSDFISVTADNPFVDPVYARKLMSYHRRKESDFSEIEGLPFGVFSYAVNTKGLSRAVNDKAVEDSEVWGGYFRENSSLRCSVMSIESATHRQPSLRLTVDEISDFEFAEEILKRANSKIPTLDEIIAILSAEPQLSQINSKVVQKTVQNPSFRSQIRD